MTEPASKLVEGQPVNLGDHYQPIFGVATMDVRNAAASALKAYLGGLTFFRSGLGLAPDNRFGLDTVYDNWPDSQISLDYPSASVVDASNAILGHNFVPTMLTETAHEFGENTVLWKVDEMQTNFQVDFWTNDEAVREGIMAVLPGAFSPSESRTGILVRCSERYFSRTVRLVLDEYRRTDTGDRVFDRERRVITRISAEIDVVQLRHIRELQPSVPTDITQGPPVDCC